MGIRVCDRYRLGHQPVVSLDNENQADVVEGDGSMYSQALVSPSGGAGISHTVDVASQAFCDRVD